MKEKNRKKRKLIIWIILCIILGALILFDLPLFFEEPHFQIYKNESGELVKVDYMEDILCYKKYNDSIVSEWRILKNQEDCNLSGNLDIKTLNAFGIEWLDEDCECAKKNCEFSFNASKRAQFNLSDPEKFTGKTFEGLIWFTTDEKGNEIVEYYQGDVDLIEKCNPCQEYKCGENYVVEVWNQIK